jgi:hypothetical protein
MGEKVAFWAEMHRIWATNASSLRETDDFDSVEKAAAAALAAYDAFSASKAAKAARGTAHFSAAYEAAAAAQDKADAAILEAAGAAAFSEPAISDIVRTHPLGIPVLSVTEWANVKYIEPKQSIGGSPTAAIATPWVVPPAESPKPARETLMTETETQIGTRQKNCHGSTAAQHRTGGGHADRTDTKVQYLYHYFHIQYRILSLLFDSRNVTIPCRRKKHWPLGEKNSVPV